jgi:transcriptional regulator with XRE-family HTH domain
MAGHNKEEIARLVKNGRMTKGYTQQELSDVTRISLRSIQRIENAEVLPRLYTLKLLADKLGFSLDDVAATPLPTKPTSKSLNRPRKLILSVGSLLLIILLTGAFLSQSARFPETNFERFLLYAGVTVVYGLALFRIWR